MSKWGAQAAPSRSRRGAVLLVVLLAHMAWLALLQQQRRQAAAPADVLSTLRIVPLARPAMPAPPRAAPVMRAPPQPAPHLPPLVFDEALAPPAAVLAPAPPAQPAAVAAPAIGRSTLNLSLPPERAASAPRPESLLSRMLNDPRANSAKRTLESAVADAAGTLPVTVQGATDGTQSQLIRQGSKCIRVSESRLKTLNPMDEGARNMPAATGSCFTD